jgi:FKBP-type peptidyl-prolyl cis-trans isomerase FkpA/FKBP-type peptidyl-prolyl cis-trans isomerase FklB
MIHSRFHAALTVLILATPALYAAPAESKTVTPVAASTTTAPDSPLTAMTDAQKFAHVVARQVGQNLKSQGVAIDLDAFTAAFKDAYQGKPDLLTAEETQSVMEQLSKSVGEYKKAEAERNKKIGDDFLKKNKKKKGVKTTKSGLQYIITAPGEGKAPSAADKVKVHYRGTLIDGSEFDSSYKRGQPAEFPLSGVIKGWTEGLQLLKPGGKATLFIPAALAYGEQARPGLPANSTLIFEVELLEVIQ